MKNGNLVTAACCPFAVGNFSTSRSAVNVGALMKGSWMRSLGDSLYILFAIAFGAEAICLNIVPGVRYRRRRRRFLVDNRRSVTLPELVKDIQREEKTQNICWV